jgi:integrase
MVFVPRTDFGRHFPIANLAAILTGAMVPLENSSQIAVMDLADVRGMLIRAEAIPAHPSTRLMLRLMALTAVRDKELRSATPAEFEGLDGREPVWRLPAARTKMGSDFLIPLSRQSADTVTTALGVAGQRPRLVFPSVLYVRRPMSENTIKHLLRRAGYQGQDVPGRTRTAFSSIMKEKHPKDRAIIDLMVTRAPKDRFEDAYNFATDLGRQRVLAQIWADMLLDGLIPASDLIQERQR